MENDEKRDAPKILPQNPKSTGVTLAQLSKFQELQRKRLQLISKQKNKFKAKGAKTKLRNVEHSATGSLDEELKDPNISTSSSQINGSNEFLSSSSQVDVHPVFQKKKLHWGLDSKERWERKANM